ncbi:hypothetical protein F5B19DRAFT_477335 [Rostrohypoxylon terebratum]|nr:hypothetical protein F5B19DRAFT_477335 [Rostrohypoxylon terebratum]
MVPLPASTLIQFASSITSSLREILRPPPPPLPKELKYKSSDIRLGKIVDSLDDLYNRNPSFLGIPNLLLDESNSPPSWEELGKRYKHTIGDNKSLIHLDQEQFAITVPGEEQQMVHLLVFRVYLAVFQSANELLGKIPNDQNLLLHRKNIFLEDRRLYMIVGVDILPNPYIYTDDYFSGYKDYISVKVDDGFNLWPENTKESVLRIRYKPIRFIKQQGPGGAIFERTMEIYPDEKNQESDIYLMSKNKPRTEHLSRINGIGSHIT